MTEQPGSFVSVLRLADDQVTDQEPLDLDLPELSSAAFDAVATFLGDPDGRWDDALGRAVDDWSRELGVGGRTARVELVAADGRTTPAFPDHSVRQRILSRLSGETVDSDALVTGVVFAADFERQIASVRLLDESVVRVQFSAIHADDIQASLRELTDVRGVASSQARTGRTIRFHLDAVAPAERSVIGPDDVPFEADFSVEQLAARQGVIATPDPDDLVMDDLTDDERIAFAAAMSRG